MNLSAPYLSCASFVEWGLSSRLILLSVAHVGNHTSPHWSDETHNQRRHDLMQHPDCAFMTATQQCRAMYCQGPVDLVAEQINSRPLLLLPPTGMHFLLYALLIVQLQV
jgi:hypothetical protein